MKRVIKADEKTVWQAAMRGVRRTPIAKPDDQPDPPPAPPPSASPPAVAAIQVKKAARTLPVPPIAGALDGETARRLKTKATRPQARLDLHGMTEAVAHKAVIAFIEASAAKNRHLVLVITGKGKQGTGILRRNLPLWLEAARLKPLVLALAPAFTADGGEGAFYIHLKRRPS